jgi:indoleamine 2,3-dioxygenase
MAPLPVTATFPHVYQDPTTLPSSVDPFSITTTTGFLPTQPPLQNLPPAFADLTRILDEMPIVKADGIPGLLAEYKLGPLIDGGALRDLTGDIDRLLKREDGQLDMKIVTAVFRDYSFLGSAYLLEPCWEKWNQDHSGGYGLGRSKLPRCIAGPLVKTAGM